MQQLDYVRDWGGRFVTAVPDAASLAVKIAVTGASGFVGRHVVAELRPARRAGDRCRARDPARLGVVPHDVVACDVVGDDRDGRLRARSAGPTCCCTSPGAGCRTTDSLHHFERELPAQYRFLQAMVAGGLRNVVVTGTCFEYGMQSGPLHEELDAAPSTPTASPRTRCGASCSCLRRQRPFALTWARLFYLWGDGQAPNSLWPQLRTAALRGDADVPHVRRRAAARLPAGRRPRRRVSSTSRWPAPTTASSTSAPASRSRCEPSSKQWIRDERLDDRSRARPLSVPGPRADGVLGRRHQAAPLPRRARRMTVAEAIYRADRMPVLQNRMFDSAQAARDCAKGDVVLVQSSETGLVFNQAFEPELMVYDRDYQNEQGHSAAFQRHLQDVAARRRAPPRRAQPDRGRLRQGPTSSSSSPPPATTSPASTRPTKARTRASSRSTSRRRPGCRPTASSCATCSSTCPTRSRSCAACATPTAAAG